MISTSSLGNKKKEKGFEFCKIHVKRRSLKRLIVSRSTLAPLPDFVLKFLVEVNGHHKSTLVDIDQFEESFVILAPEEK